ncbi:MAG: AI-2E family transporter [Bacteroidetes bacterium]|nr:AI-2E family transporter [Bacteroidota bacterium]
MNYRFPLIVRLTFILLFIFLFFYGVIVARNFLGPLVLAGLFSYLLLPLVNFLERHHIHRVIASLFSLILLIGLLTFILILMYKNVVVLVDDLPTLKAKAISNIDHMSVFIQETFGFTIENQKSFLKESVNNLFKAGSEFTNSILNTTTSTIFKLGILPVFIFYLLYYRHHIREFLEKAIPAKHSENVQNIIRKVSFITPRYIGGVFTVVMILCVLNSLGLYIIGMKHAIVFGIISAMFCFIPYFGTWIGASIPFLFALLTGDSPNLALHVIFVFLIIQFTENNILTPNITGSYVHLNPLSTILSLIVGGMIWGLIGMFVIVPIMAIMKIIFDQFEPLQPYAFLIGERVSEGPGWLLRLRSMLTIKKNK